MKVIARFTDADGKIGGRIDNLRWFLNLVSGFLKRGQRLTITFESGCKIEVEKQTSVPSDLLNV
jgi:hypothetical protein